MIIKQQTYNAGVYCRLSAEDNLAGESGRISTQRTLLTQYCKDKGFNIAGYYVDDGFSGTNFDRPDFERLLNDIDKGKINVVLTKDLSRFGRDYIQAGYFIEKVFDRKNVRYIAVDDNIDTLNNNNDILMPIKNVLNDMYARDVSRKTRAAFNAKARNGEYTCWFYKTHGSEYCSSHYITYDNIYNIVMEDIRKNARLATKFESRYLKQLLDADSDKQKKQLEKDKKEIEALKFRIADLDKIIKKLYEDNALGKITDKRFASLSGEDEKEQQELAEKLDALQEKVQSVKETADKAQQFLGFIRKYTEIETLDAKILNELIDKILVEHKTVNEDGEKVQKIEIYYKFVGLLQAG